MLSPSSDLVTLRKKRKAELEAAKGPGTFDDAVRTLLECTPAERVRERIEGAVATAARIVSARRSPLRARSAEKQILTARAARERWSQWLESGRVRRTGPRRVEWAITPPAQGGARVVLRPGRGLPP